MTSGDNSTTVSHEFHSFTEAISCAIFPVTHDRRLYLDEKVVEENDVCFVRDRHYESGETYYDPLTAEAKNIAELSDFILRELYARGFSANRFTIIERDEVSLEYSFLNRESWIAHRRMEVVVRGDITDEKDHRRDPDRRGTWFSYPEVIKMLGSNRAHKIFEVFGD